MSSAEIKFRKKIFETKFVPIMMPHFKKVKSFFSGYFIFVEKMAGKGGRGLQIMVALLPSYELIFLQHICLCVIKMFSLIKR